ncbi:BppU family phage baseplate upper protein [Roseburia sp. 831b]|uniref:BppU family phage baseplate upper protein n=1 Tax=Roseburia sp. 831b TaxID=1261635 RepID=UPI0009526023|nr:BppU family phage baseplate upper protein [Roseburia sp. 831b]WVK73810.1 BppU family phage baseplate upper protein [Roseburia sp. 831b]
MSDINISNTDIVLDLYNNNFVEVTSKQYDKSTRTISALISEYGKVIQIPNGVTAQVRMKKPDGKGIIKDCTISNNKIVIVEDEQMLLFAGRHKVDVVLFTDTQRVSTLSFILVVESAAVSDEDVLSSNEYSALDKALKDCRDTVADINRRLEAGEFNGGPPGTRGSQWTQGTSITGTDTSPTVFNASGISDALVNDCYFNTATGNTYRCVSAGDASQAKWVYTGCLKSISNSSAITEEGQYSIDAVQANPSIEGTLANKQERINESLTQLNTNLALKQDASTAINTSNIGSQSVNYATSAGNAGTVGGYSIADIQTDAQSRADAKQEKLIMELYTASTDGNYAIVNKSGYTLISAHTVRDDSGYFVKGINKRNDGRYTLIIDGLTSSATMSFWLTWAKE